MRFIILFLTFTLSVCLYSQVSKQTTSDIFQALASPDSLTGATVNVIQDERIEKSLYDRNSVHTVKSGTGQGFRIQVFPSNVQRTAKTEAFAIEKEIRNAFPETKIS